VLCSLTIEVKELENGTRGALWSPEAPASLSSITALHPAKQSFGKVRSQGDHGNEKSQINNPNPQVTPLRGILQRERIKRIAGEQRNTPRGKSRASFMRDINAKPPSSGDRPLAAAAVFLVVAYVGLYYATVHRPTGVVCQYYACNWHGTRYFLADSLFCPIDWLDRQFGVSHRLKLRRFGIANRAYREMCSPVSAGRVRP
jgi:hypothetical protein